jgi:hypothetical protein
MKIKTALEILLPLLRLDPTRLDEQTKSAIILATEALQYVLDKKKALYSKDSFLLPHETVE